MPDILSRPAGTSGFAELVYADPAWLRAEFDAIMTANLLVPPCRARTRLGFARPRHRRPAVCAGRAGRVGASGVPASKEWAEHRQRSPPRAAEPPR